MFRILLVVISLAGLAGSVLADDLYKANLHSIDDAELLNAIGVEPLLWTDGGYLILAGNESSDQLRQTDLDFKLLATEVTKDQLVLDNRLDRKNTERLKVLFETDGVRLLQLDKTLAAAETPGELLPIRNNHVTIEYYPASDFSASQLALDETLDNLVNDVDQDTLYSYVCSLQTYPYRTSGSEANTGARNWLYNMFVGYGYDSVYLDHFLHLTTDCYNVVATKLGTIFPDKHIIVCGHFDAVSNSPGADDNGSGTSGVLELARLLKDVDLPVSVVFIAFDAEEDYLKGSEHYAATALAEDEEIIFVQNMDMIGNEQNSEYAKLYYGAVDDYAVLWKQMAQYYSGITGVLSGSSTRSDHYPFQQAGYDVCFCYEYIYDNLIYHTARDSTTHMNFDYMTRMVKASLATVYSVAVAPPPTAITSIFDPNDGQSLEIHWQLLDGWGIDYYRLSYYRTADPGTIVSQELSSPTSSLLVEGLTDGEQYCFYVQAFDVDGYTSPTVYYTYSTPNSVLTAPYGIVPLPQYEKIRLDWVYDANELKFDHFSIIRDGVEIAQVTDTTYIDEDPSLGSELHEYHVTVIDSDGLETDTSGLSPALMKAATLQENRVLAVNRSAVLFSDYVDGAQTEAVMREALSEYDYDFIGDTTYTVDPDDTTHLDLFDMVDYELVVIGAETALKDDIGDAAYDSGLLDSLAYYMSIGGKVVIFGRWGKNYSALWYVSYDASSAVYDDAYYDIFLIDLRAFTPTGWTSYNASFIADLVGAHSVNTEYPDLAWDSLATVAHSNACGITVSATGGIPYATFVELLPSADILYTYDSRDDINPHEGSAVAWRYIGADYKYIFFDIPLSFFERNTAASALRQAIDDMLNSDTWVDDSNIDEAFPGEYTLRQNYPNPFNPATEIIYSLPQKSDVTLSIYNILGQHVTTLVDGVRPAGTHSVQWNGTDTQNQPVATGIYFYRLNTADATISKKMLLLK